MGFLWGFLCVCFLGGLLFLIIILIIAFRLQTVTLMMFVDSNRTESTNGVSATGQLEKLHRCGQW